MRASILLAAAIAAIVTLTGCERQQSQETAQNAAVDTASAEQAIRAEEAQWNRDYAARDVDAIMRHYAEDAALTEPGSNPGSGSAAIRAAVTRMVGDPAFRLEFGSDRIQVASSGDLGFTRGHFTLDYGDPAGRTATMRGTYLTVWRKQADGSWKAVEDMITPGPAPAAAG